MKNTGMDSTHDYFKYVRKDIMGLLPENIERAFEVGCGDGNTLRWLKEIKHCRWTCGIELNRDAAEKARGNMDVIYRGDIESYTLPIKRGSLDLILCLDVLEHLVDPWKIIGDLHRLLRPGGALIASIPNVAHYSVVIPLVLRGEWRYMPAGILDRTHLRFFDRNTCVMLLESSGLRVDRIIHTTLGKSWRTRAAMRVLPDRLKRFLEYQYIIRSVNEP